MNFTTAAAKDVITITVAASGRDDSATSYTTTTIQVSGVYGTGSTNGRLTQITGLSGTTYTTSNFDTFGGNAYSFTLTATGGDADLNGNDQRRRLLGRCLNQLRCQHR